jgi:phospholipase A1
LFSGEQISRLRSIHINGPGNRLIFAILLPAFATLLLVGLPAAVSAASLESASQRCMLELLDIGEDNLTLGDIRERCEDNVSAGDTQAEEHLGSPGTDIRTGGANRRLIAEREAAARPFSILAHKPNYVLAGAYNFEGWDSSQYKLTAADPDYENKDVEVQFQISLKVPLALDLFGDRMDIYGAYTNRSFWQMYNREYSEPFRETNHEPEIWTQFDNQWQVFGFTNVLNAFGFVHQSNGLAGLQSRSWNRLYANFVFERNDIVLSFKPWLWVSKNKTESDNPDITDFMGHGEFRAAWQRNGHVYSMMLRNQLESGFEKGAVELGWSIPVFDYPYLKAYVQYFYGYGESLIDYDRKTNRIGLGISMTDWID